MPPKSKDTTVKKIAPQINRPPISDTSLFRIPENAVEGFQERIETGIEWTLIELAARHHKKTALSDVPSISFSEALQDKLNKSILSGFLHEHSSLTLEQQSELLLPITLWDVEKFANEEGKICFENNNCITDDLVKMIKRAVRLGDREVLKNDLENISVLRINDSKMTNLDKRLTDFQKLVNINLCGNYLSDIEAEFLPKGLKTLEIQANFLSNISNFVDDLPFNLLYLGLARNLLTNDYIEPFCRLPYHLTVLDLSDNDIYHLEPVLDVLSRLPNLQALLLFGNPCAVCAGYAKTTLMRLPKVRWLDCRQVLATDRQLETFEPHPDDLRAAYFFFTIFRIMGIPPPPKPEKGATTTFHVELELPLLDATRRTHLMYHNYESLIEMLPPPEDGDWPVKDPSTFIESRTLVESNATNEFDIYNHLTAKNSREICHFTTFESNRVQWNKIMNFQEPTIKIFCPDLVALRNTFRTVITVKLIYTVAITAKSGKSDKKSAHSIKIPGEQRVTLATIKCALRQPDWSRPSQHFHWDDTLGTNDALDWGEGDLSVLQFSQAPVKVTKGKQETDTATSRQMPPDNITCHFGFGIDTLKL